MKTINEETLRILQGAIQGFAIISPEGTVLYVNPAGLAILGASEQDVVGKPYHTAVEWELINEQGETLTLHDLGLADGFIGKTHRLCVGWKHNDRVVWVHSRIYTVFDEDTPLYVVHSFDDVTDRIEIRREREQLHIDRELAVQNFSHESRTSLSLILGYVELMASDVFGPVTRQQRHTLKKIILPHVHDLIVVSNHTISLLQDGYAPGKFEPMEMGRLLRSVVFGLMPLAKQRFGLAVRHGQVEKGIRCCVNEILARQSLHNLLFNALKFTPKGGAITVSSAVVGDEYVIAVQDTGIGIPSDKLCRIFERFVQVDGSATRKYGGVGLGLAVVKKNMEAHNGRVTVESEVGKGSTFRLHFPIEKAG